ncbi:MAG: AIR synthase related protein [Actinomycetes bacterium]
MTGNASSYAAAGVDTAAGDLAVELMKAAVGATHGPQVLGGVGGFAGLWDASALTAYRKPLLATSTDGVGTKVAIAQALDIHDTIGQDLVAMVVDDIVVVGAKPLFMTDYIACGKVHPQRIADIVRGIAEACTATGTALVGGETAEHPGLLGVDDYDVAGAAVGVVEADEVLVATGRRPRTDRLGLETIGLAAGEWLRVDDTLRVEGHDWLYAVGDVNHRALLTHQGKYQARAAGDVIAARARGEQVDDAAWGPYVATADHDAVPSVAFTSPEVASVGLTAAGAAERGIATRVADYELGHVAGASLHAEGYRGRARLVIDDARDVVIGFTAVGDDVAELVHGATIAIVGEVPVARLQHAVPSYPTMSEIWLRLLETDRSQRRG